MKRIENIEITKWQGVSCRETKQTTQGYLWLHFLAETTIINVNPNVIGAKPTTYAAGRKVGLSIKARNRKEAIETFQLQYQIIH